MKDEALIAEARRLFQVEGLKKSVIASRLGVKPRRVYYWAERGLLDDEEMPEPEPPTQHQKTLAEELWQKGYTLDAIIHAIGVVPAALFSWIRSPSKVDFGGRIVRHGLKEHPCSQPEHREVNPGIFQCHGCPRVMPCDAQDEYRPWEREKEWYDGRTSWDPALWQPSRNRDIAFGH